MSITTGTAANLAGSVVPAFVSLVTIPLYIQIVGQDRYGILLLIWLLLGYFNLFDLGLGRATTQRIAAFATASDDVRARIFWTALLLNTVSGFLGAAIVWLLGELVLGQWTVLAADLQAEALGVVPWLAATVPIITVSGVLTGALQGRGQFLVLNLVSVSGAVVGQIAPLIVATLWEPDVRLLVPVVLLARALSCVVLLVFCRHCVPLWGAPAIDPSQFRPLLMYGGWIIVDAAINLSLMSMDRFLIGAVAGAKAVTQYSVPFNLSSRLAILPDGLSSALFPRFAVEAAKEGSVLLERAVRGLAVTLTPLVLIVMIGMRPFLAWWVGADFSRDAATVGEVIAFGLWLSGFAYIPHALLQAKSRPDLIAKCHLVQLPIYVGLLWAGLHFWGVTGAAMAWSLRVAVDAGLLFWFSGVRLQQLKVLIPSAVLIAAMAVLVWTPALTSHWRLIFGGAVLLASGTWSWRDSGFPLRRIVGLQVPARLGL